MRLKLIYIAGEAEYATDYDVPNDVITMIWHDSTRIHRFFLSFEQAADMAELFPEFAIDLSAARLPVYKGELNGQQGKFYYFHELLPHHRTAIVEAGGVIEDRM
jgi:hypothetical protein